MSDQVETQLLLPLVGFPFHRERSPTSKLSPCNPRSKKGLLLRKSGSNQQ